MKNMRVQLVLMIALLASVFGAGLISRAESEDHWLVFTDGNAIFRADSWNPGAKVRLLERPSKLSYITFWDPFVAGNWLWYDRTESGSTHGQRLFRSKWARSSATYQMTRDPWGRSQDMSPITSAFHLGCLYQTDRRGEVYMEYTPTGTMGPGFGRVVPYTFGTGCWGHLEEDKNFAYMVGNDMGPHNGIYVHKRNNFESFIQKIPYSANDSVSLNPDRLSMTLDKRFLLSCSGQMFYLAPGEDIKPVAPAKGYEAFISQYGNKIVYTDYYSSDSSYHIFSADINQSGATTNAQEVLAGFSEYEVRACYPSWCHDSMFFTCSYAYVKLDFSKPNNNIIKLSGTVLVPEGAYFSDLSVDFGGVKGVFAINPNPPNPWTFRLNPRTALGLAKTGRWSLTFPKGSYADALTSQGLVNADVRTKLALNLSFTLSSYDPTFPDNQYNATLPMKYIATYGRKGVASLTK